MPAVKKESASPPTKSGYDQPCYWHGIKCIPPQGCLKRTSRHLFEADQKNVALKAQVNALQEQAQKPAANARIAALVAQVKRLQEEAQSPADAPLGQIVIDQVAAGLDIRGSKDSVLLGAHVVFNGEACQIFSLGEEGFVCHKRFYFPKGQSFFMYSIRIATLISPFKTDLRIPSPNPS